MQVPKSYGDISLAHSCLAERWLAVLFQVVESEPRMGADFCFNVYDGKRALMVAASSQDEKVQWMEDIVETVQVKQYVLYIYIFIYLIGIIFLSNTPIFFVVSAPCSLVTHGTYIRR